jgi:uncharacterized Tic20 family protein
VSGTFEFDCPVCGKTIQRPLYLVGTKIECPDCHERTPIPDPDRSAIRPTFTRRSLSTAICRKPFLGILWGDGSPAQRIDQDAADRFERERALRKWVMLVHLSHLFNFIFPSAGLLVQLALWQWKRDEFPEIEMHAKNGINWALSSVLYCLPVAVSPGLAILFVLSVAFPVIAAVKANDGIVWIYPLSIRFLS